jgi:hypothetical protein
MNKNAKKLGCVQTVQYIYAQVPNDKSYEEDLVSLVLLGG